MRPSGPYRLSARRCETGAARRACTPDLASSGSNGERQRHRQPIPGARQMGPVLEYPFVAFRQDEGRRSMGRLAEQAQRQGAMFDACHPRPAESTIFWRETASASTTVPARRKGRAKAASPTGSRARSNSTSKPIAAAPLAASPSTRAAWFARDHSVIRRGRPGRWPRGNPAIQ